MIVIGILGLLVTITVVGMKSVGGNAKDKQARTVLETMRSALAQAVPLDNPTAGDKFYGNFLPRRYEDFIYPSLAAPVSGTIRAREKNGKTGFDDNHRNAQDVIIEPDERTPTWRTVSVVQYLSSNAAVKAQIEGLPNQLRRTVYINSTIPTGSTPAVSVTLTSRANAVGVTVPVDPWGTPLEFVFGGLRFASGDQLATNPSIGGLSHMYSTSAKSYWQGTRNVAYQSDVTSRFTARPEAGFQGPDKGAYWVSAGPDGFFETHDDNVYSFEGN